MVWVYFENKNCDKFNLKIIEGFYLIEKAKLIIIIIKLNYTFCPQSFIVLQISSLK